MAVAGPEGQNIMQLICGLSVTRHDTCKTGPGKYAQNSLDAHTATIDDLQHRIVCIVSYKTICFDV